MQRTRRERSKPIPKRGRNRRALQDEYDRQASGGFDKFANGTTKIRLLPNPDDSGLWFVKLLDVYIPGATKNDKKRMFVSPMVDDSSAYCPVHAVCKALDARGDKEMADEIRPHVQYASNVMVKKGKKWVLQQMKYPKTVWRAIAQWELARSDEEEEDEFGRIDEPGVDDPDTGRIIAVERTETRGKVTYQTTVTDKELPAKDEWMDDRIDLAEYTLPSNPDDIEDALCEWLGVNDIGQVLSRAKDKDKYEDEEEDEEEEEERPRRGSRRRTMEEDEEYEGDEEGDEEDEEEEEYEPPRRNRHRKVDDRPPSKRGTETKRRRFEEEEEEEEEEEAPRRTRPKGRRQRRD